MGGKFTFEDHLGLYLEGKLCLQFSVQMIMLRH